MFRPTPPPPPAAVVVTLSSLERIQSWFSRHKLLTSVVVIGCGTVAYKSYKRRLSAKKIRRAHRSSQGGRTEVVVIAGSPALPLTKALALDMERRGFIVYIVCSAAGDANMVEALSRPDIRALAIDTTNVCYPQTALALLPARLTDNSIASRSWCCHREVCRSPAGASRPSP